MATGRRSVKREAILALLRSTHDHPDARWVYDRMREEYPDISLGTVYRNLRRLVDEDLIVSVGVVSGQERFDADTSAHAHFICAGCGAVMDLKLPEDRELSGRAERELGVQVLRQDVKLRGLCEKCLDEDMRA